MLKQFKVLTICARAGTALDLEDTLRLRSDIPTTVFHEGMSILEHGHAAAYFADEEFGAQILICSEIDSEDRNLQFARHLVLLDLPTHPDLLEQRIGRLGRINQRHTIQLHIPYLGNNAQQRPSQWYHQALNAFLSTCPIGNALQHEFGPRLLPLLGDGGNEAWGALLIEGRVRREALKTGLRSGRDHLLKLNSGGADEGETLMEAIEKQDGDFILPTYMEHLFDTYGIHSEDYSEDALILKPSRKMLDASFPLDDDEDVTITYGRAQTLARENTQFLTWEHPVVQGGIDPVPSGSMGNTSVVLIENKALKPDVVLLKLLFASETMAPRTLQLDHWLPPQALRCLLNANGSDLAGQMSLETLNDQLESVPWVSANKLVQTQCNVLAKQFDMAEDKIVPHHEEHMAGAKQQFAATMDEEPARLAALKAVNPGIHDNGLDSLRIQRKEGLTLFNKASLHLGAIRILIAD